MGKTVKTENKTSIKEKPKSYLERRNDGRRAARKTAEQRRGLIYVGHIPHGFYEEEIKDYFTQFGAVTNIKVCRSSKTGNSKGYAFVEFKHAEVGKVAADSMNNYLMFKKRIIAEYIPFEKRPVKIFQGPKTTNISFPCLRKSIKNRISKNKIVSREQHLNQAKRKYKNLQNKLDKLKNIGIEYNFTPVDVPKQIIQKITK